MIIVVFTVTQFVLYLHKSHQNICDFAGVSGNTVYAVPSNLDFSWKEDLSVMEFPRDNLKFVEKLGEGQFGEVRDENLWV